MQLNEEQKNTVAEWIAEGLSLSDIQDRMGTQWNIRMTYMEARMLVGDLKLLPKDPIVPVAEKPADPARCGRKPREGRYEGGGSRDPREAAWFICDGRFSFTRVHR